MPDAQLDADLVLRHATLIPCAGPAPRRGPAQGSLPPIHDGTIASAAGRIVFVGSTEAFDRTVRSGRAREIDLTGRTVLPGFVDPHTHVVFAGDRRDELQRRLGGETYQQIAAAGGGILSTVRATRAASEDELVVQARPRLKEMLCCGTTTAEAKSGYGLDTEHELKILRAIRRLSDEQPVELVPTLLGAHALPHEYERNRDAFVDLVVRDMVPAAAAAGLAVFCDVFCEAGAFSPDESRAILEAGRRAGLSPRIHADEFGASGGSTVAAAVRARSADHLIFTDAAATTRLAEAGVVATLTPVAAFYLKLGRFAPARRFIEAGVPVALATDLNPGGGHSPSMPFAITLACFAMGLTLEEALVAATINAAYSVDRHDVVGSLEPGKQMDAVVIRSAPVDLIRVGAEAVEMVVKRGVVVVDRRSELAGAGVEA